jgi:hypothetical protein
MRRSVLNGASAVLNPRSARKMPVLVAADGPNLLSRASGESRTRCVPVQLVERGGRWLERVISKAPRPSARPCTRP